MTAELIFELFVFHCPTTINPSLPTNTSESAMLKHYSSSTSRLQIESEHSNTENVATHYYSNFPGNRTPQRLQYMRPQTASWHADNMILGTDIGQEQENRTKNSVKGSWRWIGSEAIPGLSYIVTLRLWVYIHPGDLRSISHTTHDLQCKTWPSLIAVCMHRSRHFSTQCASMAQATQFGGDVQ